MSPRMKEAIDRALQAIERRVWGFTWRDLFQTEKAKREQTQRLYFDARKTISDVYLALHPSSPDHPVPTEREGDQS